MPPEATEKQIKNLAKAMLGGERDRARIGLTIGRAAMDETLFPASSYGVLGRVKEALTPGSKTEDKEKK
jgi:hypothetical protein